MAPARSARLTVAARVPPKPQHSPVAVAGEEPLVGDEGEALSLPPTTVTQRFVLCGAASGGKRAMLLAELQQLGSVPLQGAKVCMPPERHTCLHPPGLTSAGRSCDRCLMRLWPVLCSSFALTRCLVSKTHPTLPPPILFADPATCVQHVTAEPAKPKERNLTKVLVFVNQIKDMKDLAQSLRKAGARCDVLHGERSQREREDALLRFRNGQAPVLLCSDVAARGIDVPRLPAVINFDPPTTLTQYTHRLGRTGRQGAGGTVISLLKTDASSRHFAGQARTLLSRMGLPLPEALEPLLSEPGAVQRSPAVTSELKAQDTEPPLPPLQAMGSLLDFAASFA